MTAPSSTVLASEEAVQRLVAFFETITVASVNTIPDLYAPDARFKDPFNDVTGHAAITRIFAHMFEALEAPRFVVRERIVQGQQCFLTWEFRFRFRRFKQGEEQVVLGSSHLVFNNAGLVTLHRDYWDAAEELYEKLPVVGTLMRWLKKRANS
jgi:steroid delta-isomerase